MLPRSDLSRSRPWISSASRLGEPAADRCRCPTCRRRAGSRSRRRQRRPRSWRARAFLRPSSRRHVLVCARRARARRSEPAHQFFGRAKRCERACDRRRVEVHAARARGRAGRSDDDYATACTPKKAETAGRHHCSMVSTKRAAFRWRARGGKDLKTPRKTAVALFLRAARAHHKGPQLRGQRALLRPQPPVVGGDLDADGARARDRIGQVRAVEVNRGVEAHHRVRRGRARPRTLSRTTSWPGISTRYTCRVRVAVRPRRNSPRGWTRRRSTAYAATRRAERLTLPHCSPPLGVKTSGTGTPQSSPRGGSRPSRRRSGSFGRAVAAADGRRAEVVDPPRRVGRCAAWSRLHGTPRMSRRKR